MAAEFVRQSPGFAADGRRIVDQMAAPTLKLDCGDLLGGGQRRHHGDKRQREEAGKVGFGDRRRTARCFDDGRSLA